AGISLARYDYVFYRLQRFAATFVRPSLSLRFARQPANFRKRRPGPALLRPPDALGAVADQRGRTRRLARSRRVSTQKFFRQTFALRRTAEPRTGYFGAG